LIHAQLAATQADIRLKRVVGRPLASAMTLSDPLDETLCPVPEELSALSRAQADRVELRITQAQVQAETYALSAARAGYLPAVAASADYGFSGNTPESTARTGSFGGRLDLPLFSGGLTHGQVEEAKGRKAAAQSQHDDTRIQVEENVRLALQTLPAEIEDVKATERQMELAGRELKLAQDRYGAGVGDNIQVVSAQTALANARKSRVDAHARYADAEINVTMALGHMRDVDFKKKGTCHE